MWYDSYIIETVLKTVCNKNYAYCIEKEVKAEPGKAFQLVKKMLKSKPSSVWCSSCAFLVSLPIALLPQSDIHEARYAVGPENIFSRS